MLVVYDWAGSLELDEKAIENEKKVVSEERRMIYDVNFRIQEALKYDLIPESKYAQRNVIGSEKTFMNFTAAQVRNFYKKWYRPEVAAVIIVGDVNPDEIESKLIKLLSDIPSRTNPQEYPEYKVTDSTETLAAIVKDKDYNVPSFGLEFRHKPLSREEKGNVNGFAYDYLTKAIVAMTNERLQDIISEKSNHSNEVSVDYDLFMGAKVEDSFNIFLEMGNDSIEKSIKLLLSEVARIKQHGFTNTEYERAKFLVTSQYQNKFEERDKIENTELAESYIDNFLYGKYIPGSEMEYRILNDLLPQISIDMVNDYVREMMPNEGVVLFILSPEGKKLPSKELLSMWYKDINNKELEPYIDKTSNEPLLTTQPVSGKIISEDVDNKLGAVVYKLSNGAKVVVKQTDFKNNEILFIATSPGGFSLFPEDNMGNIKLYPEVIDLGGVGNFSKMALQKKMAGKNVSLVPVNNVVADGLKGTTTSNNLEELLQLVYLQFTSPRRDVDAFNAFVEKKSKQIQNETPNAIFNNALNNTIYPQSDRMKPLTLDELSKADYQQIMDLRDERYADASDFTFMFVGNINPESSKELFEKYLASLPSTFRKESAGDVDVAFRKGSVKKVVEYEAETPQAITFDLFTAQIELNQRNRISLDLLANILKYALTNKIRGQEGGTYAVLVNAGITEYPKGQASLTVKFTTKPGNEDNLNTLIKDEINNMALEGPTSEELKMAVDDLNKKYSEAITTNKYWISILTSNYSFGINDDYGYTDQLNSITVEDVKTIAAKFTKDNLIEVVVKGQ